MPSTSAGILSELEPPGAPQSTFVTLDELASQIEAMEPIPFLPDPDASPGIYISEPGHYVLTDDVRMNDPDATCISISGFVSVTIDLNGHTISGPPSLGGQGRGIYGGSDGFIVIRNGAVEDFGRAGITQVTLVEDVQVRFNGEGGVELARACHRVVADRNLTTLDTQAGILVNSRSIVRDCVSIGTLAPGAGIRAGAGSSIIDSAATEGFADGIVAGEGSTITGCSVETCPGDGIVTEDGCTIANCSVTDAAGNGIIVGSGGTASGCSVTSSGGSGFLANLGSSLFDSTASGSAGHGFFVGSGAVVRSCAATENTGDGFNLGDGSAISDSVARRNTGNGITVAQDCRVVGNTCDSNGLSTATASGIEAQGDGNLIDGNTVTDNDAGIEVASDENMIVRNTAINNGVPMITNNYPISGTNQVGPIITATGTISTTNPWANFSQ